jgi:hypothetical protein
MGKQTSSGCAGPAHDFAKVEDQVRFLAGTSLRLFLTLEPDGKATGCNPVQVGSTPTGVLVRIELDPLIVCNSTPSFARSLPV